MIYRCCFSLIVFGFFIGSVTQLAAEDLNPPPWDVTLPNQTSQDWDATVMGPIGTDISGAVLLPVFSENPFGMASVTLTGTWDYQEIPGPRTGQGDIPTWHVGEPSGSLVIKIPNNPLGGDIKQIFWQITSDQALPTPTTSPSGTVSPPPYPQGMWPVDNWYTYNGMLTIRPNPASETITFPNLLPSTNITEIVIDTVCITVPEPGTFALLGLAAIGLLACVWRRRT